MSIQCPELDALLRKRLSAANLPPIDITAHLSQHELTVFNARQEVMMQAAYDFAIKQARRELKKMTERTEP